MNFYKIDPILNKDNRLIGSANGANISHGDLFFHEMQQGNIILDVPTLDYFFLESYEDKKYWDLHLMDIHTGTGTFPIGNWLISDKLKQILEDFKLAKEYHFYESRLLYQNNKIKYWLYQFIALYRKLNKTEYVDFKKSEFLSSNTTIRLHLCNYMKYLELEKKMKVEKDKIITNKISLNSYIDFISLLPLRPDIIVSERLKTAIEDMGITGFKFLELDYEVVVEE